MLKNTKTPLRNHFAYVDSIGHCWTLVDKCGYSWKIWEKLTQLVTVGASGVNLTLVEKRCVDTINTSGNKWRWVDTTWQNYLKLDQTWEKLKVWQNLTKLKHLTKCDKSWLNMRLLVTPWCKFDVIWRYLTQLDETWWNLTNLTYLDTTQHNLTKLKLLIYS